MEPFMIHLSNLSMAVSLLNERAHSENAQAAREHVVAIPASEPDPENPPVIGPHHHNPGSPSEGIADPLSLVALNPQPLPPIASLAGIADMLSAVALNPQPLPPKEALASISDRLSAVAINPQPLPPEEALENLNRFSLAGRFG
jgi:hypothetical protein